MPIVLSREITVVVPFPRAQYWGENYKEQSSGARYCKKFSSHDVCVCCATEIGSYDRCAIFGAFVWLDCKLTQWHQRLGSASR